MLPLIGLIPLLPLVGFLVCGIFGKRLPKRAVTAVACGSVLLAFLVSLGAVWDLRVQNNWYKRGIAGRSVAVSDEALRRGDSARVGDGSLDAPWSYSIHYWAWLPEMPLQEERPGRGPHVAEAIPHTAIPGAVSDGDGSGEGGEHRNETELQPEGRARNVHLDPDAPRVGLGDREDWAPPRGSRSAFRVNFGFRLDPLSAVMILVVTGVGLLIHVYSIGYMGHDPGYARYFSYLNLFTSMMLLLVLGSSFLVMFVGWEGVGLCSYLLIGFWFSDEEKAQAGRKAFITNRIGDFAFIVALLAIVYCFGTLDIQAVMSSLRTDVMRLGLPVLGPPVSALTLIALALFFGACGKSAQIPLYVWLPDAMAGPTPVSALIHAATMVTAGVYMVARCSALFVAAPGALTVVAVTGALTALFAASIGLVQNDIKKVLAYSTVSQLGYMFLAAGVGAFSGSIFHLVTHAFFKALLFLGAGSVIHAMSGEQDLRRMGGLKDKLPTTYWTMMAGALAIAGIPPFAGFFSKDEILGKTWESGHPILWAMGAAAAAMTAFYMFRLIFLAFHGTFRGTEEQRHHLHESPKTMTVPLTVLAVLSIVGGFIGIPYALGGFAGLPNVLERWLEPVLASVHTTGASGEAAISGAAHAAGDGARITEAGVHAGVTNPIEYVLMLVAVAIAVGGILTARAFYARRSELPARAAAASGPVYPLLLHKYWVDELYDATVLRAFYRTCDLFSSFDRWIVDGLVNAVAGFTELVGQALRLFQTGFVRNYALWIFVGAVLLVWMLGR